MQCSFGFGRQFGLGSRSNALETKDLGIYVSLLCQRQPTWAGGIMVENHHGDVVVSGLTTAIVGDGL